MRKRKRRTFTGEFKREAVPLCQVGSFEFPGPSM